MMFCVREKGGSSLWPPALPPLQRPPCSSCSPASCVPAACSARAAAPAPAPAAAQSGWRGPAPTARHPPKQRRRAQGVGGLLLCGDGWVGGGEEGPRGGVGVRGVVRRWLRGSAGGAASHPPAPSPSPSPAHLHRHRLAAEDRHFVPLAEPHRPRQPHLQLAQVEASKDTDQLQAGREEGGKQMWRWVRCARLNVSLRVDKRRQDARRLAYACMQARALLLAPPFPQPARPPPPAHPSCSAAACAHRRRRRRRRCRGRCR